MGFAESDRDIGPQPLGPPIDFSAVWSPDDAFPGAARPPNNVEVRAMLPQPVYRAMQVLVHREDTPFGAPSDIVRAAVWHYLRAVQRALDERHPAYVDALHREQLRANNEQLSQQHAKLGETLEHIHDQLTALLDSGRPATREAARRLAENDSLSAMLGEYWRDVYGDAVGDMAAVKATKEIINERSERDAREGPHHAVDDGVRTPDRREDPRLPIGEGPTDGRREGDSQASSEDRCPDCHAILPCHADWCWNYGGQDIERARGCLSPGQ